MSAKARRWLRKKTFGGDRDQFRIKPNEGGFAGSLVGLKYIERLDESRYRVLPKGLSFIHVGWADAGDAK